MSSTTYTLTSRISTLSESTRTTNQLIQRLAKIQFQPGSSPLNSEEGDVRVELSSEIHDSLRQQEEDLELLTEEVQELNKGAEGRSHRRDSNKDKERARLTVQVTRLGEDIRHSRNQFRAAQVQAKRSAEQAHRKERELLFAGIQEGNNSTQPTRRQGKELTKEERELAASGDVTSALRRTHQLMQTELTRSRFAQETLNQSTAALNELSERYSSLGNLLQSSKALVKTLISSQKTDNWYLETAFAILVGTIAWLLFRRLLWGPTSLVFWIFIKPVYRVTFFILSPILSVIGLGGAVESTSSLAAESSSLSRSSLIVKHSATGGIPRRDENNRRNYHPVGGGGHGAKVGSYPPPQHQQQEESKSEPGSMSEQVGKMAEASQQGGGGQQQGAGQEKKDDVPRRADGQPLEDKPEVKRNPKKRMMEEPVVEGGKDEL